MVAGGLPKFQALLDDGTGTFPYDVTSYVRLKAGVSFRRGRGDELSEVEAGDSSIVFDNSDGRFTLGSTVIATPSPILGDRRVRFRVELVSNTSFETDVSGYTGSNATLARSTAQAHSGAASMALTAVTAASMLAVDSGSGVGAIPVQGGVTYPVEAYGRAATVGRAAVLKMDWWDTAGAFISTTTGTPAVDTTTGWTYLSELFTAPANAAFARRQYAVTSPALGEVHYVDDFRFGWNRFTHHVQNWPVEWPSGDDQFALAGVSGTDVQAKADRQPLKSIIQQEYQAESTLTAMYSMGEPSGAMSAGDTSGNQAPPMTGTGYAFGTATGPTTDALTAVTLTNGYLNTQLAATPAALEVWFSSTQVDAVTSHTLLSTASTIGSPDSGLVVVNGHLTFNKVGDAGLIADGLWHHVRWQGTTVYLDNVLTGLVASAPTGPAVNLGGAANASTISASYAHLAAYSSPLSVARGTAHYQAGSASALVESGTARITRLAGYANLPLGTLDTSLTNVGFTDITGQGDWSAIQDVADAELGVVFIDGSGNVTFHNRNRAVSKLAPDVTIDANFLTEGTSFIVDMQGVLNYFDTVAVGTSATQTVRNITSEVTNNHGRYATSKTYLVQTDQEALDRANWIVSTHAEPLPRVGSLALDLLSMTAAQQQQMLSLEVNSWVRITGLPGQTPGGTSADFTVQGIADALSTDGWTLTLNAANRAVASPTPWILGDATYGVLGTTTRLYV